MNKEFRKHEKLIHELRGIQGLCSKQYFAPEKCPDQSQCHKIHVDQCFYPCIHYFAGNCKYGFNCRYSHLIHRQIPRPDPSAETCKRLYYDNYCPYGNKCKQSHDLKQYPCMYNTLSKCKFDPEDCRYSHDKFVDSPVICFFDLMKGCNKKPEECTNSHVLPEQKIKYLSYDGSLQ